MKKYIFRTICALGIAVLGTSCMDLDPKDQLSDAQVWTTADNFTLFANQFYSWTRDFQGSTSVTYMNGYSDGPHSDLRSDLMCQTSVNVYSAGSNSIPSTDANYNNLYKRIYYTNLLLDRAEDFSLPSANPSERLISSVPTSISNLFSSMVTASCSRRRLTLTLANSTASAMTDSKSSRPVSRI